MMSNNRLKYIFRLGDEDMIKSLQFWLEVDELVKQDDKREDRLYRTCTAWNIFNKYINAGSSLNFCCAN